MLWWPMVNRLYRRGGAQVLVYRYYGPQGPGVGAFLVEAYDTRKAT
jgi:hypothetical protein